MNATEMQKLLSIPVPCEGLSEWIETKLVDAFRDGGNVKAVFNVSSIQWKQREFIAEMESLGYRVETNWPDSPIAFGTYIITFYNWE